MISEEFSHDGFVMSLEQRFCGQENNGGINENREQCGEADVARDIFEAEGSGRSTERPEGRMKSLRGREVGYVSLAALLPG